MRIESLFIFKSKLVLQLMKQSVDFAAIVNFIFIKHTTVSKINIPVYVPVKKGHLILGAIAILSAQKFVGNLKFHLIMDYSPGIFDKFILYSLGKNVQPIPVRSINKINSKLSGWSKNFFESGWQGKKFFVPLMHGKYERVIVMDPDTIFTSEAKFVKKWLGKGVSTMHLKDCGNYVAVSTLEANSITGENIKLKNLNSGLILLNRKNFWKYNSVNKIEIYIKKTINMVRDRKTEIIPLNKPFLHVSHLLEQTLYWYTLNNLNSGFLEDEYFVFGRHIYNYEAIKSPVFIHFAGELNKKSMYRYIFFSLLDKIKKRNSLTPWFAGKRYCVNCWHRT
jgi:hypothetical protein